MMQRKTWAILLGLVLAAAAGFGVYYYYNQGEEEPEVEVEATEPVDPTLVAAVVDGEEVLEVDVAFMVDTMRTDSAGELLSDEDWALRLDSAGMDPESIRESVIKNQFAVPILVLHEAAARGIYPDQERIDDMIAKQKETMGEDENWQKYIEAMGFSSEESYRRFIESQDVTNPLLQEVFGSPEPSQEETDEFFAIYGPRVTGKRSSAVAIAISELTSPEEAIAQAEDALAQIHSGADFGEVSDSASSPEMGLSPGGDMGWQALVNLPYEYTDALEQLAVGQVSGVVVTESAVFIIKCTDEYYIDDSVDEDEGDEAQSRPFDIDGMPADLRDYLMENLPDYVSSERPNKYFAELLESDKIVINPMPKGLPYDVDMALAQAAIDELPELEIIDIEVGTGPEAQVGDLVRVTYVGMLDDGSIFDASEYHEGYFEFTIGAGEVITGWDEGLVGMRVGGVRTLVIPPHLAYGEGGAGSIPPNATLTFQIELLAVNGDYGEAGGPDGTE